MAFQKEMKIKRGLCFTCSKGEDGVEEARRGNRKKEESMRVSIPFLFRSKRITYSLTLHYSLLFVSLVSIFNERRFMKNISPLSSFLPHET